MSKRLPLIDRLRALADYWEQEYITDDGWPLICAYQLREELRRESKP